MASRWCRAPGVSISVAFDSKENTSTSHDPELYVALVSAGPQGPQGSIGPVGPIGPQGPGGFSGMQEFTNTADIPLQLYVWTAPAGVSHVLVELWGAGGGAGPADPSSLCFGFGGGGGGYSRSVINVIPGDTYSIFVGGGGQNNQDGNASRIDSGGKTVIFAGGGGACVHAASDPTAAINRSSLVPNSSAGQPAFGATFSPAPMANSPGEAPTGLIL